MGEVVKFRRPRRQTVRGIAREQMTEAVRSVGEPDAIVVIALGANGSFAIRAASKIDGIKDFDMFSRARAICEKRARDLLEMDE